VMRQLPVIPLGVDTTAYRPRPQARADWRARLGIGAPGRHTALGDATVTAQVILKLLPLLWTLLLLLLTQLPLLSKLLLKLLPLLQTDFSVRLRKSRSSERLFFGLRPGAGRHL